MNFLKEAYQENQKAFMWAGIVLLIFITNIVTYLIMDNKVQVLQAEVSNEVIRSSLVASESTMSILEFSKTQLENEIIEGSGYSNSLAQFLATHDGMENDIRRSAKTKKNLEEVTLALEVIKLRKEGFENLKSSVDIGAENFDNVAEQKFQEAKRIGDKLVNHIKSK